MDRSDGLLFRILVCSFACVAAYAACLAAIGPSMAFLPGPTDWGDPAFFLPAVAPVAWCAAVGAVLLSFFSRLPRWFLVIGCALGLPVVRLVQTALAVGTPENMLDPAWWKAAAGVFVAWGVGPALWMTLAYVFIHALAGALLEKDPRN